MSRDAAISLLRDPSVSYESFGNIPAEVDHVDISAKAVGPLHLDHGDLHRGLDELKTKAHVYGEWA